MLRTSRAVLPALVVAVASMAIPTVAEAKKKGPKLTVMTRNVFLGADLSPSIDAPTIPQAIDGAAVIWRELQSTRFADRARPLAREIKRSKADLVGLQEVALWRKQAPSDGGAPPLSPLPTATPATQVEQDFLKILRRELKRVGAKYRVVVVQKEFDAELPVDEDGNDATGFLGAEFDARLTMRDVILVRRTSNVKLGKTRKGHFQRRFEPSIGGLPAIKVDRGWTSVEARLRGKKFRFVNTHLEAFGDARIREAQAKELTTGPLATRKQVVLVGDLNSGVERHRVRGDDQLAFRALAGFGMKDRGAVQSCCYSDLFDPNAVFDHTVDHVLTKPGLRTLRAVVTGDNRSQRTASGLWPSDHGGVVSTLRLKR